MLLPCLADQPLGRRSLWPIYEAAARHGLPVGIHAGSTYRHPVTPVGWPSYFTEDYVNQAQGFQTQLTSLVCEGVFSKFPALKVVLIESGFTWLPSYLWRLHKYWRGLRMEIPWVDRPPPEIIREQVRFTLQPVDAPVEGDALLRILDQAGSDELLLFSTDYPHWQFDGQDALPPLLPDSLKTRDPETIRSRPIPVSRRISHESGAATRPQAGKSAIVRPVIADCDIHPCLAKPSDILPYLPKRWQEHAMIYGMLPRHGYQSGPAYPKGQPDAARLDSWPPDGRPGSDLGFMQAQHLDANRVELGIMTVIAPPPARHRTSIIRRRCRAR